MHHIFKFIITLHLVCPYLAYLNPYSERCVDSWFRLDEHTCIHLSERKLSSEQSKNYCQLKFNAHRLTIANEEKQRLIARYLNGLSKYKQQVNDDLRFWIGLNRVKLNAQSTLLWDTELELYETLSGQINDEMNKADKQIDVNLEGERKLDESNEKLAKDANIHRTTSNSSNRSDDYQRFGLINLNPNKSTKQRYENQTSHLTNLLATRENVIANRLLLKFDNRYRHNQVDNHFYITNQTDKWKMTFSPSTKLYTICELPLTSKGRVFSDHLQL